MTAKPRVLLCSNNIRGGETVLTHETSVTMQTTPSKSRTVPASKSTSKLPKPSVLKESQRSRSATKRTSQTRDQPAAVAKPCGERENNRMTIFRSTQTRLSSDLEDMLTLKRANPIYESDDEEYVYLVKRQKKSDYTIPNLTRTLATLDQLVDDDTENHSKTAFFIGGH